jgi:nitrilase
MLDLVCYLSSERTAKVITRRVANSKPSPTPRTRLVDFEMNVKYIKNSLKIDSPEMETIKKAARDCGIAVSLGFSENEDDSLYISQVLIGADGEVKLHRRKMKPTHMERTIFGDASGHCLSGVAKLPFGRVGQLSCWEHIQPLLKFNTMSQREQIHVSAWPSLTPHTGGPDLWSMSAEGTLAFHDRRKLTSEANRAQSRLPHSLGNIRH